MKGKLHTSLKWNAYYIYTNTIFMFIIQKLEFKKFQKIILKTMQNTYIKICYKYTNINMS